MEWGCENLEEFIIVAICLNLVLLAICWLAASRAGVIVSSIVWVLIGFQLYREFSGSDDALLLLGIVYMVAFVQVFMPLNPKVKGRDKMVQFRQGMLGVAVVVVAIAGALLGSWAMSMDVEERTVTTYDALTDITPLFDTEMAPAYTDYNPATNYTGYYTEVTTIGDKHYFGGVDYTEAKRPNNYKVNQPPLEQLEGTLTVPTDGSVNIYRFQLQRWLDDYISPGAGDGQYANWTTDVEAYSLADILAQVTTETTGTFKLASIEGLSALTDVPGPVNVDWLVFGSKSMHLGAGETHSYFFGTEKFYRNFPSADNQYHNHIALSMSADLDRNVVTLYSDNAFQHQLKVVSLDDVIILAGGETATGDHDVCLGTTGTYEYSKFPEASYMDPSGGVEVVS